MELEIASRTVMESSTNFVLNCQVARGHPLGVLSTPQMWCDVVPLIGKPQNCKPSMVFMGIPMLKE
eukprot:2452924-Amphidinium_carterae.1